MERQWNEVTGLLEFTVLVSATMGELRAVVGCTALLVLLALPPPLWSPSSPIVAYASSGDDDTWQGTITVVRKAHTDTDETQKIGPGTKHHISRYELEMRQTYSDFQLASETDEHKAWIGPGRVNLTLNEHTYTFHSSFWPSPGAPLPDLYEEDGYDATASGATVAQGKIRFGRYRDQEDPKKTKCHIEVDGQEGWRPSSTRGELQVGVKGHSWQKARPGGASSNWDRPVDQRNPSGHGSTASSSSATLRQLRSLVRRLGHTPTAQARK